MREVPPAQPRRATVELAILRALAIMIEAVLRLLYLHYLALHRFWQFLTSEKPSQPPLALESDSGIHQAELGEGYGGPPKGSSQRNGDEPSIGSNLNDRQDEESPGYSAPDSSSQAVLQHPFLLRKPPVALIVGIDRYLDGKFPKLKNAEKDARDMKAFLQKYLRTTEEQIIFLLNEMATRASIIEAFKRMKEMSGLEYGDPILVYFAGHGTKVVFDNGDDSYTSAIVPHDYGPTVPPIPGRTIALWLGDLSEHKGDNITVIMDSCHSGSGTRGDCTKTRISGSTDAGDLSEHEGDSIAAIMDNCHSGLGTRGDCTRTRISDSTDAELITDLFPDRQPFRGTHVLLASCSEGETASDQQTYTTELLKLLKRKQPGTLSYADVGYEMNDLPGQNPQCFGRHRNRIMFTTITPPPWFRVKDNMVMAGPVHGIGSGATLRICDGRNIHAQLATATISNVSPARSRFESPYNAPVSGTVFAVAESFGAVPFPLLYVHPDILSLPAVRETLHPSQQMSPRPNIPFSITDDRSMAHCELRLEGDELTLWTLNSGLTNGSETPIIKLPTDPYALQQAMSQAAHFFFHLYNCPSSYGDSPAAPLIQVELKKILAFERFGRAAQLGPNLLRHGRIEVEIEEKYGFRIVNTSELNLYLHLFYFDYKRLEIRELYGSGSPGRSKTDPCLPVGRDLKLGLDYNKPLEFSIPDNDDSDIGAFKLVLTSNPVDLSSIATTSLASNWEDDAMWTGEGIGQRGCTFASGTAAVDAWETMVIPVFIRKVETINVTISGEDSTGRAML